MLYSMKSWVHNWIIFSVLSTLVDQKERNSHKEMVRNVTEAILNFHYLPHVLPILL